MIGRSTTDALVVGVALATVLGAWIPVRAADESGERLYDRHCRKCHGPEGRGARAPSLIPFEWSYQQARDLIRQPLCDMPPIPQSDVSDAEIARIVAYLKTIK